MTIDAHELVNNGAWYAVEGSLACPDGLHTLLAQHDPLSTDHVSFRMPAYW